MSTNTEFKEYRQNVPNISAAKFEGGEESAKIIIEWLREHNLAGSWRQSVPGNTDAEGNKISKDIPEAILIEGYSGDYVQTIAHVDVGEYVYQEDSSYSRVSMMPAERFEETFLPFDPYLPTN